MPLFHHPPGRRGRFQRLLLTQVPFTAVTLVVLLSVAVLRPSDLTATPVVAALVLCAVCTVAAAVLPWERLGHWMVLVSAADLVIVALLHAGLPGDYRSVLFLLVFPVASLAYAFRAWALVVAVAGAVLVAALPIVFHPDVTIGRRVDLILLPVSSAVFAGMVHVAARTRRSYEESLRRARDDSRRAHLRLAEADEVTTSVADTMTVGIGLLRTDGTLRFTNAAFDAMAKRAEFDTASLRADRGFDTDRVTRVDPEEAVFRRALQGRFGEEHLYWVGEPGDQRGLLVTAHPLTRSDGASLGIAMIAYDVTDLVTAVRIRDEFLTTVTHELRTPLTSIVGYLDLIEESEAEVPEVVAAHLRVVSRNVDELLSRVGDLLDASAQDVELDRRVTRVGELVLRVVESGLPAAEKAGVVVDTAQVEEVTARVDELRLGQVITNLLSNAVKYTPHGGHVSIVVCADGDDVVLEFRDDGVGIAPEDQVHVFTRFFRADEARLGAIPGTGIGLPIAKKLTESHGGTLTLVSRVGEGSTFTVRIPRDLPGAAPESSARTAPNL